MSSPRAFIEAVLEQLQRPSVETMGFEELRAEVLALRTSLQTLYDVWQEAEEDVEKASNEGAAWMQRACVEWAQAWVETGASSDTQSLIIGLEDIPLPTPEGEIDAE